MLAAGDMVTPTVRLVRQLAEGGMGSVWVAEHLALSTQVAVKFMTESGTASPGAMQRFAREATAAAKVKSPHIVQIFDHGISQAGDPFIVMELLEGRDLRDHLLDREALSLDEVKNIVTQTCRALSKAHAAGVIHRDIKPDNLFLLEPDGELFVKLLDFGVAKQESADAIMRMTSTGTMVGTPYYMSPEQSLGLKTLDFRTDLWSLAVVTYQACVGSLPFGGDTIGALFVAIDRAEFAAPSFLQPGLPPEVDAWFVRALARDPANRFASAREMAEAFEAAVEGKPFLAAASAPAIPIAPRVGSLPSIPPLAGAASTLPSPTGTAAKAASTLDGRVSTQDEPPLRRRRSIAPFVAGAAALAAALLALVLLGRKDAGPAPTPTPTAIASIGSATVADRTPVALSATAPNGSAPGLTLAEDAPSGSVGAPTLSPASSALPTKTNAPTGAASGRRGTDGKAATVSTTTAAGVVPKPSKTVDRGFLVLRSASRRGPRAARR